MTVAAISEFVYNTTFIHFESLCLVTLEVTTIPEFACCLVLGCCKETLSIPPSLEESSKVSYRPSTCIGHGPPLELIDIIASIVVFIGYTIITALPLLSRIFRNTWSPCHG